MMARRDEHMVASGVKPAVGWTNHYSPKYDKCFSAIYFSGDGKETPFSSTVLMDAFERNIVATPSCDQPGQATILNIWSGKGQSCQISPGYRSSDFFLTQG
jgi:hypothetical protein